MTKTKTATRTATRTAKAKFVKPTKLVSKHWPSLAQWPVELGAMPGEAEIALAHAFNRPGGAVTMAWAMYARPGGATDNEAAIAARCATGSKSASHRVKVDQAVKAGQLAHEQLAQREGGSGIVRRIALPVAKAKAKATRKAKAKAPAKAPEAPASNG